MQHVHALLPGREQMPAGDPSGDVMNDPKKHGVSQTLENLLWRERPLIRNNVVESVRTLKAQRGRSILTDGSSRWHTLRFSMIWSMVALDYVRLSG